MTSQETIGQLANRIERAYRRRYPSWKSIGLTPGVWESAASRLAESIVIEPLIPLDPEFFVLIQARTLGQPDPWADLTQQHSLDRYHRATRRIVNQLRKELRTEVQIGEKKLLRGTTLEELLSSKTPRLSPLSLYILAHRAGREDLSSRLRTEVEGQHRSCPLYKPASRFLLPTQAYPSLAREPKVLEPSSEQFAFSVN